VSVVKEPPVISDGRTSNKSTDRPSTWLIIINILFLSALSVAMVFILPVFGAMFANFGPSLPAPTRFFIALSSAYKKGWWWMNSVFAVVIVLTAVTVGKRVRPRTLLRVAAALQFVLLLIIVISMFLPVFQFGPVTAGAPK
jgi:type II secretory pathway component PulF